MMEIGDIVKIKDLQLFKASEPLDNLHFMVVNFSGEYAFLIQDDISKDRIFKIKKE